MMTKMPAMSARDQVLKLPIEIRPPLNLYDRIAPIDPGMGLLVPKPRAGTGKCEIPTGQRTAHALGWLSLYQTPIYGRPDRSELVGGGRRYQTPAMALPPCYQPLARRPGNHCAGRGVRFFEPVDRRAHTGRGDPASRLRRRSGDRGGTSPDGADAANAAFAALHFARRERRGNVRGSDPEERRQGLPAAGAHYPGPTARGHHGSLVPQPCR